ncbi:MAG TPA: hypothetical protein VNQ76_21330, partial [Planctomicrobium sp.]|nr:hypothetical protein [Planctomicrobium sp.]
MLTAKIDNPLFTLAPQRVLKTRTALGASGSLQPAWVLSLLLLWARLMVLTLAVLTQPESAPVLQ